MTPRLALPLLLVAAVAHADVSTAPAPGAELSAATLRRSLEGADGRVTLRKLAFQAGKATLQPTATPTLDELAKAVAGRTMHLVVVVHSDARGAQAFNRRLSAERAKAVADWLAAHGVAPARLHPVGAGEWMPIADNNTADGRAKNRRVEILAAPDATSAAALAARHRPPDK